MCTPVASWIAIITTSASFKSQSPMGERVEGFVTLLRFSRMFVDSLVLIFTGSSRVSAR